MSEHLRLLETLRQSSAGLKEITDVIDQAIVKIQRIETVKDPDSEVIMSELDDTISKIKKDREVVDSSVTELPKPDNLD